MNDPLLRSIVPIIDLKKYSIQLIHSWLWPGVVPQSWGCLNLKRPPSELSWYIPFRVLELGISQKKKTWQKPTCQKINFMVKMNWSHTHKYLLFHSKYQRRSLPSIGLPLTRNFNKKKGRFTLLSTPWREHGTTSVQYSGYSELWTPKTVLARLKNKHSTAKKQLVCICTFLYILWLNLGSTYWISMQSPKYNLLDWIKSK